MASVESTIGRQVVETAVRPTNITRPSQVGASRAYFAANTIWNNRRSDPGIRPTITPLVTAARLQFVHEIGDINTRNPLRPNDPEVPLETVMAELDANRATNSLLREQFINGLSQVATQASAQTEASHLDTNDIALIARATHSQSRNEQWLINHLSRDGSPLSNAILTDNSYQALLNIINNPPNYLPAPIIADITAHRDELRRIVQTEATRALPQHVQTIRDVAVRGRLEAIAAQQNAPINAVRRGDMEHGVHFTNNTDGNSYRINIVTGEVSQVENAGQIINPNQLPPEVRNLVYALQPNVRPETLLLHAGLDGIQDQLRTAGVNLASLQNVLPQDLDTLCNRLLQIRFDNRNDMAAMISAVAQEIQNAADPNLRELLGSMQRTAAEQHQDLRQVAGDVDTALATRYGITIPNGSISRNIVNLIAQQPLQEQQAIQRELQNLQSPTAAEIARIVDAHIAIHTPEEALARAGITDQLRQPVLDDLQRQGIITQATVQELVNTMNTANRNPLTPRQLCNRLRGLIQPQDRNQARIVELLAAELNTNPNVTLLENAITEAGKRILMSQMQMGNATETGTNALRNLLLNEYGIDIPSNTRAAMVLAQRIPANNENQFRQQLQALMQRQGQPITPEDIAAIIDRNIPIATIEEVFHRANITNQQAQGVLDRLSQQHIISESSFAALQNTFGSDYIQISTKLRERLSNARQLRDEAIIGRITDFFRDEVNAQNDVAIAAELNRTIDNAQQSARQDKQSLVSSYETMVTRQDNLGNVSRTREQIKVINDEELILNRIDIYRFLGINRHSRHITAEIEAAKVRLHADKIKGLSEARVKLVTAALNLISDTQLRNLYNRYGLYIARELNTTPVSDMARICVSQSLIVTRMTDDQARDVWTQYHPGEPLPPQEIRRRINTTIFENRNSIRTGNLLDELQKLADPTTARNFNAAHFVTSLPRRF